MWLRRQCSLCALHCLGRVCPLLPACQTPSAAYHFASGRPNPCVVGFGCSPLSAAAAGVLLIEGAV